MQSRRRLKTVGLARTAIVAALAVSIGGCGRLFQPPPVVTKYEMENLNWATNNKARLPGIDIACVSVHRLDRPRLGESVVAVWTDFTSLGANSGSNGLEGARAGEFKFFSKLYRGLPRQRLEFDVIMHRDEPGTLTIGENHFDLDQGTLFLVSVAKTTPVIKQLKRNWPPADFSKAALEKEARIDAEINQFFKSRKPG